MRALAGGDGGGGQEARGGDGENGGGIVEGVDQPDFVSAHVARQLECACDGGGRKEGVDRKMSNWNARVFEFAAAGIIRTETADVRLESRTIERFRDLPQLPFTAARFERASHQQNRPRH